MCINSVVTLIHLFIYLFIIFISLTHYDLNTAFIFVVY